MSISEKIQKAMAYVKNWEGTADERQLRNDAANIFADSYEDYMSIWNALQKGGSGWQTEDQPRKN